ncbi:12390_t:CDS:1, partial [Entrophospora sp. SA101]
VVLSTSQAVAVIVSNNTGKLLTIDSTLGDDNIGLKILQKFTNGVSILTYLAPPFSIVIVLKVLSNYTSMFVIMDLMVISFHGA